MGMNYFIFKVGIKNDIEVMTYDSIDKSNTEYINYNKFLLRKYFTNIDENNDYIPIIKKNEVIMILRKDQFQQTEMGDVFEILFDTIRGKECEGDYHTKIAGNE